MVSTPQRWMDGERAEASRALGVERLKFVDGNGRTSRHLSTVEVAQSSPSVIKRERQEAHAGELHLATAGGAVEGRGQRLRSMTTGQPIRPTQEEAHQPTDLVQCAGAKMTASITSSCSTTHADVTRHWATSALTSTSEHRSLLAPPTKAKGQICRHLHQAVDRQGLASDRRLAPTKANLPAN